MYKQQAAGLEDQIQVPLICLTLKFRLLTSGTSCHVIKAVGIWKKKSAPTGHRQGSKFSLFLSQWETTQRLFASGSKHMKWGFRQGRATFPEPGATELSVSPVWEQFWCSIYATDHLQSSVFISSDLHSKAITCGAGLQPPLPLWLSSSQAPSVPMCRAAVASLLSVLPSAKNISQRTSQTCCSLFLLIATFSLPTSSSFTGRRSGGRSQGRRRGGGARPFLSSPLPLPSDTVKT